MTTIATRIGRLTGAAETPATTLTRRIAGSDAIRIEGLTKYYGRVVGLEHLTLAVPQGAVFGFLGPNGAGKTTTIRLLLDLLQPSAGAAWIGGFDCHRRSIDARRLVGYLPGELPIYPDLTGHGFLRFLAAVGQRPVSASRLEWLLGRFDISETDLRRRMRDYSQGMKRKLGIIQAVMTDAPVLVLDEPTAGLDPLMIEAFAETLHDVVTRSGATVFLSSHVLSEVEKTCDVIGLVRRGRLVEVKRIEEIRRGIPQRVTVEFSAPVNGYLPAVAGVTLVSRTVQSCVLEVQGPLGPLIVAMRDLPVHDVKIEPFGFEQYVLKFYSREEMS
jgi:ABC-2 type transport system ATP-binding protein